jgi:glycosyltransferase involved in cell wall biosynthesis
MGAAPIAVHAPYARGDLGGMPRYVRELLGPLLAGEPRAVLYSAAGDLPARHPGRVRPLRPRALAGADRRALVLRLLWHQAALPARVRREGVSVYYSPVPEGMTRPACPQVVTVHDLIPLRFPEAAPRVAAYYRHVLPRVLRASRAVVVVSRATEADLRERMPLDGVPVHVVHQGYRRVFRPAAPGDPPSPAGVDGDYVLAIAETRGYKNLRRLVEAFARAGVPGLSLVVAGGAVDPGLRILAERMGVGGRVRFTGRVGDEELAALYRGARALVFPSLWEGFGLPPLEAMASGCPVAASRAGAVPEVCGDAALYFDPASVEEMADALARAATDDSLRCTLRARGLARAEGFSYERAAERILEVVRGVEGDV